MRPDRSSPWAWIARAFRSKPGSPALLAVLMALVVGAPSLTGCGPAPTPPVATATPATAPPTTAVVFPTPPGTSPPTVPPTPAPTSPPPTPTPTPQPRTVLLRLNLGPTSPAPDPALPADSASVDLVEQLFLGLTAYDPLTAEVIPELASSWEASAGGTVWTFHLRDDVQWVRYDPESGAVVPIRAVTAADVVYAVRRAVRPETGAPQAQILYGIVNAERIHRTDVTTATYDIEDLGVRALDEHTVQFELTAPAFFFPAIVGLPLCRPLPQEIVEASGSDWTGPGVILTNGAYTVQAWEAGRSITLVRNPHHIRAGQMQIELVDLAMLDAATAYELYLDDGLDGTEAPASELARLQADPVLSNELGQAPQMCTTYLGLNTAKPPFDDVHVRRAFSYAIDRRTLVDQALTGVGRPAETFVPPPLPGSGEGVGISYDPERARDELAQAGYADGAGFPVVVLLHGNAEGHAAAAQAVRRMWEETLGVGVVVEGLGESDFLKTISAEAPLQETPHVWLHSCCGAYPDPHAWVHEVLHPSAGLNRSRLRPDDVQVGSLVEELAGLIDAAAGEKAAGRRAQMYARVEELALIEIAALAPLFHDGRPYLAKPYLERNTPLFGGIDIENWFVDAH